MTAETALWVLGALLIPTVSWAVFVSLTLMKTQRETHILLKMHQDPAKHGLGPGEYAEVVKENTRALRSHTHYLKWYIRQQVGANPPPPLEGGATGIIEEDE